jgi:hypothetical protein
MIGKTLLRHPAGQLRWHDVDHLLATQQGPRRSRARYRAEMPVTGHSPAGEPDGGTGCGALLGMAG